MLTLESLLEAINAELWQIELKLESKEITEFSDVETEIKPMSEEIKPDSFECLFPRSYDSVFDYHAEIIQGMEEQAITTDSFPDGLTVVCGIVRVNFYDFLDLEVIEDELERPLTAAEIIEITNGEDFKKTEDSLEWDFSETYWGFEAVANGKRIKLTIFDRVD